MGGRDLATEGFSQPTVLQFSGSPQEQKQSVWTTRRKHHYHNHDIIVFSRISYKVRLEYK